MSIEALLTAVDRYVEIKKQWETDRTGAAQDWDCGIGEELEGQLASAHHQVQLEEARSRMEEALNDLIDSRVRALLSRHARKDIVE